MPFFPVCHNIAMTSRLEKAIAIAQEAGQLTLAHFRSGIHVELKGDESPVTRADLEAEALIRARLQTAFPGEPVLGEEEGGGSDSPDRWVVDPIDGTKSFVCGVPLFGNLIAYEIGGQPVLGVVNFPALGETYWAERGSGAYRNGQVIHVRDEPDSKRQAICSGSFTSLKKHGRLDGLMRLAEPMMAHRTWGDAYGHMLVAAGNIQAMFDPVVSRWDVSAVIPIVEEAGGICMGFDGSPVLDGYKPDGGLELVSLAPGLKSRVLECFS